MSNGRRFDKGFWIRIGIIAFLGAIVFFIWLFKLWIPIGKAWDAVYQWLTVTDEDDITRHMYLLSAAAQVLGALFALVFSITILAAQFVTKYTRRMMNVIFHGWIIVYMIFFALSVIFPLWLLRSPTKNGSLVAVIFGSVIILLLIAFFLDMRKRIDVTNIEYYLKKDGERNLKIEEFDEFKKTLLALDQAGRKALKDGDIELFEPIQLTLANFSVAIEKKALDSKQVTKDGRLDRGTTLYRLHNNVFDQLQLTCEEFLDNSKVTQIIIESLGKAGVDAIKIDFINTVISTKNSIVAIEKLCDKTSHIRLSNSCYKALNRMLKVSEVSLIQETLIKMIIDIFNHHLEKKWFVKLPAYHEDIFSIAKTYTHVNPEQWLQLIHIFFAFYVFYVSNDRFDMAHSNYRLILDFLEFLESKNFSTKITAPFLSDLGEYAKISLGKGLLWREKIAERIYLKLANLVPKFVENLQHKLVPLSQTFYLFPLSIEGTKRETLRVIFESLFKQTSSYWGIMNKHLDSPWYKSFTNALKASARRLLKEYGVDFIYKHWLNIKITSDSIIKQSSDNQDWPELLATFHKFFLDCMIIAREDKTTESSFNDEIIKRVWITCFSFRKYGTGWDDLGIYLLNNREFARDFFNQHYRAAKEEAIKLGIPKDFIEERFSYLKMVSQYKGKARP